MKLQGDWYAARSSTRLAASLELDDGDWRLRLAGADTAAAGSAGVLLRGMASDLNVSDRVGGIARRVMFTDGAVFETLENDALDRWLARIGHKSARSLPLHWLETRKRAVLAAVVVTVCVVAATLRWGVPGGANHVAHAMPVSAHERLGSGVLDAMDSTVFEPSSLEVDERQRIRDRFAAHVARSPAGGFEFRLHFRAFHDIPNAFALPGGDVVVTDALVALAAVPEELDSVLLHEIGHVLGRHGMRQTVEASLMTLAVTLMVGDGSGFAELAAGVPVFLLQSSWSRRDESEADEFAFDGMRAAGIDTRHFAAMMTRLESFDAPDSGTGDADSPSADWYSSHPATHKRIERALHLSEGV